MVVKREILWRGEGIGRGRRKSKFALSKFAGPRAPDPCATLTLSPQAGASSVPTARGSEALMV